MRTTIMMTVKPIMLGGSSKAIKAALALLFRYSLSSCIFSRRPSVLFRLVPLATVCELPHSKSDRLITMSLEHFAREHGESTLLLIPCTDEHRQLVERNRETLENKFIIRYPEDIVSGKDLFNVTNKGKDV